MSFMIITKRDLEPYSKSKDSLTDMLQAELINAINDEISELLKRYAKVFNRLKRFINNNLMQALHKGDITYLEYKRFIKNINIKES